MNIFSISLITTAICIVISWALFAIFCSIINEAIALIKAERGRYLKQWLLKQLFDRPNGINWASLLYMHGAIDLLNRATDKPTSAIEPKLFAETLIEVVGKAHVVQINKHAAGIDDPLNPGNKIKPFKSELLNNFKAATEVLKPSDVVSFFQKAMRSAELCSRLDGTPDETEIYNCLVEQIREWYIQMQDRISYWYKKITRVRLFMLGTLVAAIVNVDSCQLFRHFSTNEGSKKVVMEYYEANAERLSQYARQTNDPRTIDSLNKEISIYSKEMDSLARAADLPIGWDYSILNRKNWPTNKNINSAKGSKPQQLSFWAKTKLFAFEFFPKLLGFLLSGLAASFGAPFWFDLLKKVYSRNSNTKTNAVS